jgi:tetratricopeptide (TPR) repeat protein
MEQQVESNPLHTLGQRLRQARLQRGLSQEELAGPEFTKGYVSALERGAVRPSLKALDVFARRLETPISEFLVAETPAETGPDLEALAEDLHYQLNYANMLIHSHQLAEALQLIDSVAQQADPQRELLPPRLLYRLPYLRGMVHYRQADYATARAALEQALALLTQPPNEETEETVRVRNQLGNTFYLQEQPQLALTYHVQCLEAAARGIAKDPSLRLSIYRNLANDYWALGDIPQAIGVYQEALALLEDYHDLERQAGIYWGLSMAYRSVNDWDQAKRYATQALHIYAAGSNRTAAAAICLNLAEIQIKDQEYANAEHLLERAEKFLVGTSDRLLMSTLYQNYAELAVQQNQLDRAAEYAHLSCSIAEEGGQEASDAPPQIRANVLRTSAQALLIQAQVEEQRGHSDAADRLFKQAQECIAQTGYEETAYQITYSYAEALRARGAFEQAMEYYRRAAQYRRQAPHGRAG